jgi:hypothetical protein
MPCAPVRRSQAKHACLAWTCNTITGAHTSGTLPCAGLEHHTLHLSTKPHLVALFCSATPPGRCCSAKFVRRVLTPALVTSLTLQRTRRHRHVRQPCTHAARPATTSSCHPEAHHGPCKTLQQQLLLQLVAGSHCGHKKRINTHAAGLLSAAALQIAKEHVYLAEQDQSCLLAAASGKVGLEHKELPRHKSVCRIDRLQCAHNATPGLLCLLDA